MTDELKLRIIQLKSENIKVLDASETMLEYEILLLKKWRIVWKRNNFELFHDNDSFLKTENFNIVLDTLNVIQLEKGNILL